VTIESKNKESEVNTKELKNTEVLDGVHLEYENLLGRLMNEKTSIVLQREVTPDDDTPKQKFKFIHETVKVTIGKNFRKPQGSNNLITTYQELKLVTDNDEELKKINLLQLELDGKFHWNYTIPNYKKLDTPVPDQDTLDEVFSNLSSLQKVDVYKTYRIDSTVLNRINPYVSKFELSNSGTGYSNPRTILFDDGWSLPTKLGNDFRNKDSNYYRVKGYEKRNEYREMLELLQCPFEMVYPSDGKFSIDYINDLNPTELFQHLDFLNTEMREIDNNFTEYLNENSMSFSRFLELFPSVDEWLNLIVPQVNEVKERESKLKRKRVDVELTLKLGVEIDCLDENNIKTILEDYFTGNLNDSSKKEFDERLNNSEIFQSLSLKFEKKGSGFCNKPEDYVRVVDGFSFKNLETLEITSVDKRNEEGLLN